MITTQLQPMFSLTFDGETINTYTQAEAIEIAKQLALKHAREIIIHDSVGKPKVRIFTDKQGTTTYVDYYLTERIAVCDGIVHGKPRIASGRIMVYQILEMLAAGLSVEDITGPENFPSLTREDVLDCLTYASRVLGEKSGFNIA